METKYKPLRRPNRKLCYLSNNKSPPKQWTGKLTLGDIDGMFDDLGSSSQDKDINATSPLLQTFISEANQDPKNVFPLRPPSREMKNVWNSPFKVHGPGKTSSPVEKDLVMDAVEEDSERALVVPQILDFEEAKIDPVKTQNPESKGPGIEYKYKTKDSVLESPPSTITLGKATLSNHKNQVATSCKDSELFKGTSKQQQTCVLEDQGTTSGRENLEPAVSALREDTELSGHEKNSVDGRQPSVSNCRWKDIQSFLQRVKDAESKSKLPCSRTLQALVEVPTPELEDDFLILDDSPLFYIPCKTSMRKRQTQKEKNAEESSTTKDGLEDNNTKDRQLETSQKQKGTQKANPKLEKHPVNQKIKKNKEKNEVVGDTNRELSILGGDVVEQKRPNKKSQWLREVQSKETDKAEKERKDRDRKETATETYSQEVAKRALKSSEMKSSKSSKDRKQNAKTNRDKSLKKITNVMPGLEEIKQTRCLENVKGQNENYADAEDLCSLSGTLTTEAHDSKALAYETSNQNKLVAVSEESLSEDSEVLGKRKRKQPGKWWLSWPETTKKTKNLDNQLTCKKSKQTPNGAGPLTVLVKKDSVSGRGNKKEPVPSPPQKENTNEPKNTKTITSKITRRETVDKKKTTQEVFKETEVKQIKAGDQEQDGLSPDLDLVHPRPLDLIQRDLSLSSGPTTGSTCVFQRVYQHVSIGKKHKTPREPPQQLGDEVAEKRTRMSPGKWWLVNGMSSEDGGLLQPHHRHCKEPKPCKKQKSQSKPSRSPRLGSPRNGNMAVLPKPVGGATAPSLKSKPLSTPKALKNPQAIFNDIFTSATEPAASTGDACQNNRNIAHSAEEVSVFLQHLDTPLDSKHHSVNTQKELLSGPSSMIQLEQYEENEDLTLPSSRFHSALSISDLCGPPLRPLILQPKDKANLKKWFKSLWPTVTPNTVEITPNQFDWYFYQGRAIGFTLDVDCGSACVGRILLGSYMKKPLWVDHSTTTIFNLLTSSVKVVINSKESSFDAGQCFTVQCGHAYSIQNMYAQPAVLYFTRILAESPS